jgi:hypothetical protein
MHVAMTTGSCRAWMVRFALVFLGATAPRLSAAIGGQFGFEFAIDAPWRLEPRQAGGELTYGPIPIVITFHDAVFEAARSRPAGVVLPKIAVGALEEVRVTEWIADQPHPRQPVTIVKAEQLREVERKGLVSTKTREPDREVCRPGPGQRCTAALEISTSHEWHAVFWYTPKAPVTPGRNIHLEVVAVTAAASGLVKNEWRNYLVVHAGEAPLPRFGGAWLYGDLHYHSQMTDNEGESAYTYRNVARALGALGLDFVFATDHASNGEQWIDGKVDADFCPGRHHACIEARDLNPNRFAAAKSILYGPDGANESIVADAQRAGFARLGANVPQVYMGEEVDWARTGHEGVHRRQRAHHLRAV